MKRTTVGVIAGIAAAVVAAGAILWGLATSQPPPVTAFPPWYATENARGDPAFADFEAHVPCTIDAVPDPACQRVKLGLVIYRNAVTGEPTTYVMSIVRVGVGDEREVHQGDGASRPARHSTPKTPFIGSMALPTTFVRTGRSATTCSCSSMEIGCRGSVTPVTASPSTASRSGTSSRSVPRARASPRSFQPATPRISGLAYAWSRDGRSLRRGIR